MNRKRLLPLAVLILILLSLPVILFAIRQNLDGRSRAAAADKLEAEGGNLTGGAIEQTDSNASGGKYVLFGASSSSFPFGPQEVISTPLSQGTKFVSPNGSGSSCTQASPCSIFTAANNAVGGDVVFLRGGVYNINDFVNLNKNTTTNYITFESYPGENAILDGTNAPLVKDYIRLYGNYYKLRKFEVRNMPEQGIMVMGNHNIIDGIYAHHNKLSGVNIYSPSSITDGSMGSFNTIQNVTAVDNSDAGLTGGDFNDGGNADGIAISGGRDNLILNVLVARNSDDGIDSWRSANSRIAYSISTGNGLANGNGIGFKLGGIAPSGNTQVDHSIAYDNRTGNFDPNGGENVTMLNVTSFNSRDYGIYAYPTTTIRDSISVGSPKGNIVGQNGPTTGTQSNNSWQKSGTPSFISTDPNSQNFLRPTAGGGFDDIGAWAGVAAPSTSTPTNTPISTSAPTQTQTSGPVVAFPGAEGWGAVSKGGRGGTVIEVTNLNDSGTGSFRAALTASGARTVIFKTGGTITLSSPISITNPFITIAGQTAPGGGIQIKGGTVSIQTHDVIIRGMRFRNGTTSTSSNMWDTLPIYGGTGVYNIIIDHNSISWGIDENTSTYSNVNNITYSWNIISEALMNAQHDKGAHSMGFMFGGTDGVANKVSAHHNLLVSNNQRNPRVQGNHELEILNNVIYNYGQIGMQITADATNTQNPQMNIINNYFKAGPNSSSTKSVTAVNSGDAQSIYVSGNISPLRTSSSVPDWNFMNGSLASLQRSTAWPMSSNPVASESFPGFTNNLYACSGATAPSRDSVDTRVVNDAKNGTGQIIDSPSQVGGWPNLATGTAPADSDNDGIPDAWEISHGLNPNSKNTNEIAPSGYTWLEEYINSLISCP